MSECRIIILGKRLRRTRLAASLGIAAKPDAMPHRTAVPQSSLLLLSMVSLFR